MARSSVVKVDNRKFEIRQAELTRMVSAIVVTDAATCLEAKKTQKDIRDELKTRHFILDPFVAQAKRAYDDTKDEHAKWVEPLEKLDEQLAQKVKDYERVERERAAAEERRINEERRRKAEEEAAEQRKRDEAAAAERRKQELARIAEAQKAGDLKKREAEKMKKEAEERERQAREQAARDAEAAKASVQDVKVQAAIPTVAGVPSRTNWRYRIVNANLVPDEYWMLNEQKIGADVRRDKEKTNIPGIEVYPD